MTTTNLSEQVNVTNNSISGISSKSSSFSLVRPQSVMSDGASTTSSASNTTTNSPASIVVRNEVSQGPTLSTGIKVNTQHVGTYVIPTNSETIKGQTGVIDSYPRKSRVQNPWAHVEDMILTDAVNNSSPPLLWNKISECLPGRSGKQCRERWSEHLDPTYDRSPFSMQEDIIILQGQKQLGNKWKDISSFFGDKLRTPSSVKVRWHFLDRQIKKYGASTDGLPNYPHFSYSFSKSAEGVSGSCSGDGSNGSTVSVPKIRQDNLGPDAKGVHGRCGVEHLLSYQQQELLRQQQYRPPVDQHHMMPYNLHAQMQAQAQAQSGYPHGIPAYMAPGYAQGVPMYMMQNGYPPIAKHEHEMGKAALNHDQNGGANVNDPQHLPQHMYYYNPAAMMHPPPATTVGMPVANEKSEQSTTPPQQLPFVPHPATMEQFAQLQACYYPPMNPTGYVAPASSYPVGVPSFGPSSYPNSGSSYLSRGKPPMQVAGAPVASPSLLPKSSTESSDDTDIGAGVPFIVQPSGSPSDEQSAKRKRLSDDDRDCQPDNTVSAGREYTLLQERELEKRRKVPE